MYTPNKPCAKGWPELKKYWEDYGMSIDWEDLIDMKVRSDGFYVVLAWRESDGMIGMADIASNGTKWDMQNDGFEPITKAQWERLKIVPYCDWFEYPDEEEMAKLEHEAYMEKAAKYRDTFLIYEEGYNAAYGPNEACESWMKSTARAKVMKGLKKIKF